MIDEVCERIEGLAPAHPVRVAVDGITAAGKTTFADLLAGELEARGESVLRVSMDGFHNRRAIRYRQGRDSAIGYYEDAYDFAALRRVLLDPLGPAGDRRYRSAVIDLAGDEPIEVPLRRAGERDVLLVDGSFLQKAELEGGWDLVVYLHASFGAAEERGARRDRDLLGGVDAARATYRSRYHAAQRLYLEERQPQVRADIVIDVEDPASPTVVR